MDLVEEVVEIEVEEMVLLWKEVVKMKKREMMYVKGS